MPKVRVQSQSQRRNKLIEQRNNQNTKKQAQISTNIGKAMLYPLRYGLTSDPIPEELLEAMYNNRNVYKAITKVNPEIEDAFFRDQRVTAQPGQGNKVWRTKYNPALYHPIIDYNAIQADWWNQDTDVALTEYVDYVLKRGRFANNNQTNSNTSTTTPTTRTSTSTVRKPSSLRTKDDIMKVQQALRDAGYDVGLSGKNKNGVDGIWGKKTQAAWDAYMRDKEVADRANNSIQQSLQQPQGRGLIDESHIQSGFDNQMNDYMGQINPYYVTPDQIREAEELPQAEEQWLPQGTTRSVPSWALPQQPTQQQYIPNQYAAQFNSDSYGIQDPNDIYVPQTDLVSTAARRNAERRRIAAIIRKRMGSEYTGETYGGTMVDDNIWDNTEPIA